MGMYDQLDMAILLIGKFPDTLIELMGSALKETVSWTDENGLDGNPTKTERIMLTKKDRCRFVLTKCKILAASS